jgi:pimeloyl-ACP methyl ester carboxylesterase
MRKTMYVAIVLLGLLITGYAALCALVFLQQDSLLFPRAVIDTRVQQQWQTNRIEIPSAKSAIESWWMTNNETNSNLTILYFGGNAEDVLYTASEAHRLDAKHFLATRYRGYGATPGNPSEANLFADALVVYDHAINQQHVRPENIVVIGRSLGSGVAMHLAANRTLRSLVLITPYDSMTAVAQAQFPYLPVRWLLRHRFASDQLAARVGIPVLLLAGADDSLIPPVHASRLQAALGAKAKLHILTNVGHNDIETHPQYYELINEYITKYD